MKCILQSCIPRIRKRQNEAVSIPHNVTITQASSTTSELRNAAEVKHEIWSLLQDSMASLGNTSNEELYIYISHSMNSSETSLNDNNNFTRKQNKNVEKMGKSASK